MEALKISVQRKKPKALESVKRITKYSFCYRLSLFYIALTEYSRASRENLSDRQTGRY